MTIDLFNIDNMMFETDRKFDLIFSDYVYENIIFEWCIKYYEMLKEKSIFIAMADFHSDYRFRVFMEDVLGSTFVNDAKLKCEWGNHPKDRFHQCFDSIMIYSNAKKGWKFYSDRIQVPKATAKTNLNPSGRMTKTATAWIDDITLTTTSNERVKKSDGHLIKWQKPRRLYDRVILPFTDEGDWVLDPFMGSGSLGRWCLENNRNYVGIELDTETFELAKENIYSHS
jgi:DNA modification methylase